MKKEASKKTGRPKIEIDFEQVEKLCIMHCTGEEIAGFFNISYDTLARRIKTKYKLSFADYFKRKSAAGKLSLRRAQFSAATAGNISMLIWLGKQYLGQADKQDTDLKVFNGDYDIVIEADEED